jgi:aminopeptidase-like protein
MNGDQTREWIAPGANGNIGLAMHRLMTELYPICRSITGDGVRQTLGILGRLLPLKIHEVPSGTRVFDWTVPKEWNIHDAYVKNARGERIVDFQKSNLHVVSYSVPVHRRIPIDELQKHLFSLPDHPDWIPYRTSYYNEDWGFCLSERQRKVLTDDTYEVCIDSTLNDGHLTYAEHFLQGESGDEILISCHICHPSLCNDNLSGVGITVQLAQHLSRQANRRYSYRFLFIPGTIGSITWLARNENRLDPIRHGLVVTCVGDAGRFTYKKSRRGDAEIDRAAQHVLTHCGYPYIVQEFSPYGYDERQYCSPGFNLPVGCLMRSPHGSFPEYHTSADNLEFVRPESLQVSFDRYCDLIEVLEGNRTYINLNPKCEPQLGRRGLYGSIGADSHRQFDKMALLWVLNLSDGRHSLLDICARTDRPFREIRSAADALEKCGLLQETASTN